MASNGLKPAQQRINKVPVALPPLQWALGREAKTTSSRSPTVNYVEMAQAWEDLELSLVKQTNGHWTRTGPKGFKRCQEIWTGRD